jgi:hypothetical protein
VAYSGSVRSCSSLRLLRDDRAQQGRQLLSERGDAASHGAQLLAQRSDLSGELVELRREPAGVVHDVVHHDLHAPVEHPRGAPA